MNKDAEGRWKGGMSNIKLKMRAQKVNHYTLCGELDDCYSSPLDDLSTMKDKNGRTLLDKTLIVCMGEFGRTPGDLNPNKGRDHHRFASTSVFSGGGVRPSNWGHRRERGDGHRSRLAP